MCTPASTALFACPGRTDCVQVRYRHIRQAAIPAPVVDPIDDALRGHHALASLPAGI